MIKLVSREHSHATCKTTLTLTFDERQKARNRITLDDGREAGIFLERGIILRGGDVLCSEDGEKIQVIAADEPVSTANSKDSLELARACYHLGNRHVPLQIDEHRVRYQQDHVLDEMVVLLGLSVIHEQAPFEPEAGAYHKQSHSHHNHE